jgi:replicative DNA helicase
MRELIAVCGQIQEEVLSSSGNTSEILNLAQEKLAKVIRDGLIRHNSVSLREATDKLMESLEAIASGNTATGGAPIPTGYPALDRMFSGGFKRGEFHIVAGRPSMGKTSFGMNLIRSVALDQHIPSMVFTMEADRDTFVAELICQRMRIESKCIRGMISKSVLAQLKDGCGYVQDSPLMISDDTCLSLAEIRSRIWDSVQRDGTAFVMIDYLQLIRAPEMSRRNERREQEVAEISRTLKGIAREAKVAMICLAQLNREAEGRATHIPMLSDLRESGSLEADADGVMLLYRPGYYSRDASDKSAKVIVAKQRHGPTGDVDMIFIPEYMRFEEASARQEERPENWQDR